MSRIFTLNVPGTDALSFYRLDGEEELGRMFEYRIEALADSHSLSLRELLGKALSVRIEQQGGSARYLNGLIASVSLSGRHAERHYGYELVVRPWLWLATLRSDCRIFQNKTVPQIVREVLAPYGFPLEDRLAQTYAPREYCVQYNESDAAFVSRLMESEGIYYYFRHDAKDHTLMLCDAMSSHATLPGSGTIPFIAPDRLAIADQEHIERWVLAEQMSVGKYQTSDFDFTKPRADLSVQRVGPRGHAHDGYAVFEWPGGYCDDIQGAHYGRVRLEQLQALHERARADTNARTMAPGYLFTLTRCPRADQNREYLAVRCRYSFCENAYASDHRAQAVQHDTEILVQPSSLPYRLIRSTPCPRMDGTQTATVVGPQGEEIWTDRFGRVKLQFHWDRYGRSDQNSSCWVRVAGPWSGGGFGHVQVPRIGDEVLVDFLDGNPDFPVVTGRLYNGERMPPWALPANATQSGILSRSSPRGTARQANALRFEDRNGEEQVWMHAERNLDVEAKQDHSLTIGRDHSHTVGGSYAVNVEGDSVHVVRSGGHEVQVMAGGYTLHAAQAITLSAPRIVLSAGLGSIIVDPAGVTIVGKLIEA